LARRPPWNPWTEPFRDIAGVISRRLNVPMVSKPSDETAEHFGWFAPFAAIDNPATSKRARNCWVDSRSSPG
jgi:hypothetical protein